MCQKPHRDQSRSKSVGPNKDVSSLCRMRAWTSDTSTWVSLLCLDLPASSSYSAVLLAWVHTPRPPAVFREKLWRSLTINTRRVSMCTAVWRGRQRQSGCRRAVWPHGCAAGCSSAQCCRTLLRGDKPRPPHWRWAVLICDCTRLYWNQLC